MTIDFAEMLTEVVERGASDLHLTAGAPPTVRKTRPPARAAGLPQARSDDDRARSSTRSSPTTSASGWRHDWQIDFAYSIPGLARFRVNAYFQRGALGAAFRLIPAELKTRRRARPAADRARARPQAAWLRPRHRPDRLGQVDVARGDDRRDQQDPRRAHHHDRGPDRVPARAQALPRQPARARRRRHQLLATRSRPRCARIPT